MSKCSEAALSLRFTQRNKTAWQRCYSQSLLPIGWSWSAGIVEATWHGRGLARMRWLELTCRTADMCLAELQRLKSKKDNDLPKEKRYIQFQHTLFASSKYKCWKKGSVIEGSPTIRSMICSIVRMTQCKHPHHIWVDALPIVLLHRW